MANDKQTIFDELNNIFEKRTPPGDTKNTFMLQRFLSMSQKGFWAASLANALAAKLPGWAYMRLMHSLTPVTQPPRGAYIKAIEQQKFDTGLIERLCTRLCCGPQHATHVAQLLQAQGKDPYTMFGLKTPKGKTDDASPQNLRASKVAGRKVRATSDRQNKKRSAKPRNAIT